MEGTEITLPQILAAREDRVQKQQALLARWHCPIISFTMNIAGPVKDSPLIRRGFLEGTRQLDEALSEATILETRVEHSITGSTALYAVDMCAKALKDICIKIEDGSRLGRLFDMDVLGADGHKLDRGSSRGCIVCGASGRSCAAQRAHSVQALQTVTEEIIIDNFAEADAKAIANHAVSSLLEEVNLTPKPGLVDRRNNGSHTDMDLAMFTASAHALRPYFRECFDIGRTTPQASIFPALRQAGIRAEAAMYQATNGINTHKGAIFTMGILCGSIGSLWSAACPQFVSDEILQKAAVLAGPFMSEDLTQASGNTAGERLYLTQGISGARGEAANGFPSVKRALNFFQQEMASGTEKKDSLLRTLLHLIANVDDTNLLHRGGSEGAQWASKATAALLPFPTKAQLEALDDAFIERNLSPGGCADLLAATIFLDQCCSSHFTGPACPA